MSRINFRDKFVPDIDNLKKIHKLHLYNIPFENLDIHYGKKIILDKNHLSGKILHSGRGGYCYELNGLFYFLLKELGYNVKMHSARVNDGKGGWGKEFDHLVLSVELDGLWLADVGFGDNFIEPIRVFERSIQRDRNGSYLINEYDDNYLKLSRSSDKESFTDEYIFTLTERNWKDFENMNVYHQTSPESHFTRNKVCSIAGDSGRITLTDNKLIFTKEGKKEISDVRDEDEFKVNLKKYFGITL